MTIRAQVAAEEVALFFGGSAFVPANGGVVVVGAAVDNKVVFVVVGQKFVAGVAAKGELQNFHSRQSELIAQLDHIGCDLAQVFGDDRQIANAKDVVVNCFVPSLVLGVFAGPIYFVEGNTLVAAIAIIHIAANTGSVG